MKEKASDIFKFCCCAQVGFQMLQRNIITFTDTFDWKLSVVTAHNSLLEIRKIGIYLKMCFLIKLKMDTTFLVEWLLTSQSFSINTRPQFFKT